MKRRLFLLQLMLVFSGLAQASFGISEIVKWDQLEKLGVELKFHRIQPPAGIGGPKYYRITILTPIKNGESPGKSLHRIDYWKDDRSTEIPIASTEVGDGKRSASFQLSVSDLEKASVVLRFNEPNSSAEIGWRLHLKRLIESANADKPK